MTLRYTLTSAICAAALAILSGCSSSDNKGTTTGGGSAAQGTVNGCVEAQAQDMTGKATVDLTAVRPWAIPHQLCLKVSAGTEVSWNGNFGSHPLAGGTPSAKDNASPITSAAKTVVGMGTVKVKLDKVGDFPYYCTIHLGSMQGVVYVR